MGGSALVEPNSFRRASRALPMVGSLMISSPRASATLHTARATTSCRRTRAATPAVDLSALSTHRATPHVTVHSFDESCVLSRAPLPRSPANQSPYTLSLFVPAAVHRRRARSSRSRRWRSTTFFERAEHSDGPGRHSTSRPDVRGDVSPEAARGPPVTTRLPRSRAMPGTVSWRCVVRQGSRVIAPSASGDATPVTLPGIRSRVQACGKALYQWVSTVRAPDGGGEVVRDQRRRGSAI